jgi:hypothetical protein
MTETLTHWKKLTKSDYLGAYSLEPGKDLVLTIKSCAVETVKGEGGKQEELLVIRFAEAVKPMICNKTNAKIITKIHKTPYIEQWSGKSIQLYSKQVDAFGTTTDALRVREVIPPQADLDVTATLDKIQGCTTLDQLRVVFTGLPRAEQTNKKVIELTDKLKGVLK